MPKGTLSVTVGCMFAGKSTLAAAAVRRWRSIGKRVLAVTPKIDTRYGEEGIYTHDYAAVQVECPSVELLLSLRETTEYKSADIIVIEEGQFFPDLYDFCIEAIENDGKDVSVYGLDGTARREPFGQMCRLCPIADSFEKIPALCRMCGDGTRAAFTLAFEPIPESGIRIGGAKLYAAVCRRHYDNHNGSSG